MSRIHEIKAELRDLQKRQEALQQEWLQIKSQALSRKMNQELFPTGEITLEGVMAVDWNELENSGYGQDWWDKITS